MAWSYDPTNLNTTTVNGRLNSVRLLLGDTVETDQQAQDEEVIFALSQSNNNVYFAAAWVARTISSKYARNVDVTLDGALSADYSELSAKFATLADNLEYQGKKAGATLGVAAGGITKTQIEAARENTNRIEGSFRRDQFKNPPSYETPEYE